MIFCEKCFCDEEVISAIRNVGEKGTCPICNSRNVHIYDTEKYDILSGMFDELIDIYTPSSQLPESYPKSEQELLKTELVKNWHIFSAKSEAKVYDIITAVCKEKYGYMPELFEQPVGIPELYDEKILSEHSLLKDHTWDDFVDALKKKNRYHTHYVNLKLLEKFCSYIRKPYKEGAEFIRSRISDENGIEIGKMSAPPYELTADGRANAKGIRCLYLSDSVETTIFEVRAGVYDYVTAGKFRLKKDIIVVDLKRINQISPFVFGLDILEYAINKEHLNKLNEEMGKIMRRSDSDLDYVPTQYITDFIKSVIDSEGKQEYAGIEYKSVMRKGGFNLAVFDPDVFECVGTEVYRIDELKYQTHCLE